MLEIAGCMLDIEYTGYLIPGIELRVTVPALLVYRN
jgi:hypothetical protein